MKCTRTAVPLPPPSVYTSFIFPNCLLYSAASRPPPPPALTVPMPRANSIHRTILGTSYEWNVLCLGDPGRTIPLQDPAFSSLGKDPDVGCWITWSLDVRPVEEPPRCLHGSCPILHPHPQAQGSRVSPSSPTLAVPRSFDSSSLAIIISLGEAQASRGRGQLEKSNEPASWAGPGQNPQGHVRLRGRRGIRAKAAMWLVRPALESLGGPGRSLGVTPGAMSEELLQGSE